MGSNPLIYHREDRDKRNARTKAWHKNNPEKSYILAARARARRNKLAFDLEEGDVVFPEVCPVFGIPLIFTPAGEKRNDNTPSLDRVDPSKGYTKGNVRVISWKANRLKCDSTLNDLRQLVRYMEASE